MNLMRRLQALEGREADEPVPMLVIRCGGAEPVGLCAVPGRLPEVTREPGESWEACIERARRLLRGSLPVLVLARYEPTDRQG